MKLEGDYLFDAAVDEVWSALFDPVILAAVLPGCEKLERVGGQYVGELKVKVGPIQGKFTGKVDLVDLDEPRSYRMIVDGRGGPGFVKANASVVLAAEGDQTRVRYDADAQVGGKIAGVGQRLLEASSKAIVAQSLEGLHTNIKLRAAAYRAAKKQGEPVAVAEPVAAAVAESVAESVSVAVPEPVSVPVSEPVSVSVPVAASAPVAAAASAPVASPPVAFTPVKIKQSALASSVAKEVVSSLFPRSILLVIIALQALVILWLALR